MARIENAIRQKKCGEFCEPNLQRPIAANSIAQFDCGSWLPRKALQRRLTAIRHGKFLKYKSMLTL